MINYFKKIRPYIVLLPVYYLFTQERTEQEHLLSDPSVNFVHHNKLLEVRTIPFFLGNTRFEDGEMLFLKQKMVGSSVYIKQK